MGNRAWGMGMGYGALVIGYWLLVISYLIMNN
jgi:hypothetical protein